MTRQMEGMIGLIAAQTLLGTIGLCVLESGAAPLPLPSIDVRSEAWPWLSTAGIGVILPGLPDYRHASWPWLLPAAF